MAWRCWGCRSGAPPAPLASRSRPDWPGTASASCMRRSIASRWSAASCAPRTRDTLRLSAHRDRPPRRRDRHPRCLGPVQRDHGDLERDDRRADTARPGALPGAAGSSRRRRGAGRQLPERGLRVRALARPRATPTRHARPCDADLRHPRVLAGAPRHRRAGRVPRLQRLFAERGITALTGVAIARVDHAGVHLQDGRTVPAAYSMIIPPFTGTTGIWTSPGLSDAHGFVPVDAAYRHPHYPEIYAAGWRQPHRPCWRACPRRATSRRP